jgi:DamX protein
MAEAQDSERTFLGLTHNPFVEPQRGFFERGGRKTHLEQLRHLSEWSRRVLLVTGAEGVGKTTLYRELAATLEPRVKAARINGSLVNTGFEVLSATAQGFGLASPPDANTQSLRMDLVGHVEEQTAADRLCLALVDDAHLLDNKALDSLIALAHESGLHLVFFGEVRMVPMIERAASAKGVGWQEIRLTGYGEADARDYLEWRFSQAKYRGRIPFTDNQVKDLVKLSEGLPGRINQMANVLLVKLETGEGTPARKGFPRLHAALLTLLIVVVGLLYLVVGEGGSDDSEAPTATADAFEADSLAGVNDPSGTSEEAAAVDLYAMGESMVAGESAVAAEPTAADTTLTDEADDLPLEEDAAATQMTSIDTAVPDTEAPEANAPEANVPEANVPEANAPEANVPDAEPAPADAQPVPAEPEPIVAETTTPERQIEPQITTTSAVVETPTEQTPQTVAELPPGAKDTGWLLEQDPDYFTLQLVTVSSPDSASAFVARQQEPGEFTVYQLQRDGRILHVVLYGLFSSRRAAEAAADSLPAEVGSVQPWIRPVGQVQAAARLATLQ